MIHLVLDTSIFRRDRSRQSPAFKALTRLLQAQQATLHVPEWVKREVLSQLEEDALTKLAALSSRAKDLGDVSYVSEIAAFSDGLRKQIEQLKHIVKERHGNSFNEWLAACNAAEYPTQPEHAIRLTDSYFAGRAPFSKAKNRADIPDAFIWQSVLDILKKHGLLHVVVADNRLRSCAEAVNGILAYEGLPQFIQAEVCQAALKELDEQNVAENSMRAAALFKEGTDEWIDEIRSKTELALKDRSFRDDDVPTDAHEARILSAADSEFEFQFDLTEYYGAGEIEIPFTVFVQCKIQYTLPVAAYEELAKGRAEGMDVLELDPFAYLVEERAHLLVAATLNVRLKRDRLTQSDISDSELLDLAVAAEMKIEVSDVTILELM